MRRRGGLQQLLLPHGASCSAAEARSTMRMAAGPAFTAQSGSLQTNLGFVAECVSSKVCKCTTRFPKRASSICVVFCDYATRTPSCEFRLPAKLKSIGKIHNALGMHQPCTYAHLWQHVCRTGPQVRARRKSRQCNCRSSGLPTFGIAWCTR